MCRLACVIVCLLFVVPASAQQLSLDSCLALARRNNIDIKASQLEVQKAEAVKGQVFTKYFPQVNLSSIGYRAKDPLVRFGISDVQSEDMRELLQALYDAAVEEGSDINDELTMLESGLSFGASVVQPIYVGGRIRTGNRLAKLGIQASKLKSEMVERDVVEEIESAYYLVTGLQEKEGTVASALALIDSLDHTVQSALANGLVTRADALQVQLKRNEMMANKQRLTSGLRLAKRLLCQRMGVEYNDSLIFGEPKQAEALPPLVFQSTGNPDSLRPEVALLQMAVDAERLQKRLSIGESLPQVAIVGFVNYGNLIKDDYSTNLAAMFSLKIPLTAWWETSHKIKEHNIKIEQAVMQQNHLGKMMSIEEEKAYSDMVDAYMLMKSDSSALDIAQENYRLANLNYSAGNTTINDVLMAHTQLLQAQNNMTDRHTSYAVARRRLSDLRKTDR